MQYYIAHLETYLIVVFPYVVDKVIFIVIES
jgi:hypothetical protein